LKFVAIIPSRLESSRLPNKALIDILGMPMIVHVFKRCEMSKKLSEVYVATDSLKIKKVVEEFGGNIIMTSSNHQTGTDRIAEACQSIEADVIVNIQGDEALVKPDHIDSVCEAMEENKDLNVAILVNKYQLKNNPSSIKVVLNEASEVMYFSRNDLPSDARTEVDNMLKAYHIIPFKKEFLLEYSSWGQTKLETIEFNEYLRILEKGYKIKAVEVSSSAISVDTQDDLDLVRKQMDRDIIYTAYK
tara:strand:- start:2207 stop:2944 length:738 start_codon:yes stop_codon:yes gene_type:complete